MSVVILPNRFAASVALSLSPRNLYKPWYVSCACAALLPRAWKFEINLPCVFCNSSEDLPRLTMPADNAVMAPRATVAATPIALIVAVALSAFSASPLILPNSPRTAANSFSAPSVIALIIIFNSSFIIG